MAHDGVKDPDVKARMEVMKSIQSGTRVLGRMLKGERPFDAEEAATAAARIGAAAERVVPVFQARADDPKSEASPAIWQDFADFEAEAAGLIDAAAALDTSGEAELRESFGRMGTACRSCHESYKE